MYGASARIDKRAEGASARKVGANETSGNSRKPERLGGSDTESIPSEYHRNAELFDLQVLHAGGGTRTPDTRIMIPLL